MKLKTWYFATNTPDNWILNDSCLNPMLVLHIL